MVARNRQPKRSRPSGGITDALAQHIALTHEHKVLMREVTELRDAGKIREALKAMKKTEATFAKLQEIEKRMRVRGPGE
jgi:hypothetical protein